MATYLNTTAKKITVNVKNKKNGKLEKLVFIPNVPKDVDVDLIMQARKEYKVVQHHFTVGNLRKMGESTAAVDEALVTPAAPSEKETMLEALHKSGVEEFVKLDKRNSEATIKEAFDRLTSGDFETETEAE